MMMKKIKCLFARNFISGQVTREVNPGAEWVINGEGVATRKYDGTSCMVSKDGTLYKRRMVKKGKKAPSRYINCTHDKMTGKSFGWVPVDFNDPCDKYHDEAYCSGPYLPEGTYELVGPKVQGGAENIDHHAFLRHGAETYGNVPRDFDGLMAWFKGRDIEGLVFYNKDGDMVKIKKCDFGMKRED